MIGSVVHGRCNRRVVNDGYTLELAEYSLDYDVADHFVSLRFAHPIACCRTNDAGVRGCVALHLNDADDSTHEEGLFLFVLTVEGVLHRVTLQDPRSVSFESVYAFDSPSSSLSLTQAHVCITHNHTSTHPLPLSLSLSLCPISPPQSTNRLADRSLFWHRIIIVVVGIASRCLLARLESMGKCSPTATASTWFARRNWICCRPTVRVCNASTIDQWQLDFVMEVSRKSLCLIKVRTYCSSIARRKLELRMMLIVHTGEPHAHCLLMAINKINASSRLIWCSSQCFLSFGLDLCLDLEGMLMFCGYCLMQWHRSTRPPTHPLSLSLSLSLSLCLSVARSVGGYVDLLLPMQSSTCTISTTICSLSMPVTGFESGMLQRVAVSSLNP
jgi:hypothetical protein